MFVEEWIRTSGSGQYGKGFDIDRYFCDMIDTIIIDKNLDLQWFGINEDKEDQGFGQGNTKLIPVFFIE